MNSFKLYNEHESATYANM